MVALRGPLRAAALLTLLRNRSLSAEPAVPADAKTAAVRDDERAKRGQPVRFPLRVAPRKGVSVIAAPVPIG